MSVGSLAAATLVLTVTKGCQWQKGRAGLSSVVGLRAPQAGTSTGDASAEISLEFLSPDAEAASEAEAAAGHRRPQTHRVLAASAPHEAHESRRADQPTIRT